MVPRAGVGYTRHAWPPIDVPPMRLGDMWGRRLGAAAPPPEPGRLADEWPDRAILEEVNAPDVDDDIIPEFDDVVEEEGFPEPVPAPDRDPRAVAIERERIEQLLRQMQIDEEQRIRIRQDRERFLNDGN